MRVAVPVLARYRQSTGTHWQVGPLRDLSWNGARVLSDEPLRRGEMMELWVGLPLFAQPTKILSQVVWQRDAFSGSLAMNELGLQFTGVSPETRLVIAASVQRAWHDASDPSSSG